MTHTKGDHCPQDWSATAGSWWGEPCFCKVVQELHFSVTGASGNGQVQIYTPGNNAAAANNAVVNWTFYPDSTFYWPSQPVVSPVWIHYDHHCSHEETVKVLVDLVKHLIDKLEGTPEPAPNPPSEPPPDTPLGSRPVKAKIGTQPERPVKETTEKKN